MTNKIASIGQELKQKSSIQQQNMKKKIGKLPNLQNIKKKSKHAYVFQKTKDIAKHKHGYAKISLKKIIQVNVLLRLHKRILRL